MFEGFDKFCASRNYIILIQKKKPQKTKQEKVLKTYPRGNVPLSL